ncbi:MAG TPA: hypothetical protein VFW46_18450 [Stellaceae bacterium]|nr:hypothetical protein [Stellaceae bacterium]
MTPTPADAVAAVRQVTAAWGRTAAIFPDGLAAQVMPGLRHALAELEAAQAAKHGAMEAARSRAANAAYAAQAEITRLQAALAEVARAYDECMKKALTYRGRLDRAEAVVEAARAYSNSANSMGRRDLGLLHALDAAIAAHDAAKERG